MSYPATVLGYNRAREPLPLLLWYQSYSIELYRALVGLVHGARWSLSSTHTRVESLVDQGTEYGYDDNRLMMSPPPGLFFGGHEQPTIQYHATIMLIQS